MRRVPRGPPPFDGAPVLGVDRGFFHSEGQSWAAAIVRVPVGIDFHGGDHCTEMPGSKFGNPFVRLGRIVEPGDSGL